MIYMQNLFNLFQSLCSRAKEMGFTDSFKKLPHSLEIRSPHIQTWYNASKIMQNINPIPVNHILLLEFSGCIQHKEPEVK